MAQTLLRIRAMRWRHWGAGILALIAVALIAAVGLERGWWRLNHPDPDRFPVWGIDVSHHQGEIDWARVAVQPHLRFAWIKATEGGDWVDSRFAENWERARRTHLQVGAYHFFTFCRPAAEQAENFLRTVPRVSDALPPALDVEFGGNCREVPPPEQVRSGIRLWLELVEGVLGVRPVVYLTPEAHEALWRDVELQHPVWIRRRLQTSAGWTFWQFDARGRLPGISTHVDLNVFSGDEAAFDAIF